MIRMICGQLFLIFYFLPRCFGVVDSSLLYNAKKKLMTKPVQQLLTLTGFDDALFSLSNANQFAF